MNAFPPHEKPIHCRSAYEEPTVQELSNLYNDVYDEETGTFNSMSKEMKNMYMYLSTKPILTPAP